MNMVADPSVLGDSHQSRRTSEYEVHFGPAPETLSHPRDAARHLAQVQVMLELSWALWETGNPKLARSIQHEAWTRLFALHGFLQDLTPPVFTDWTHEHVEELVGALPGITASQLTDNPDVATMALRMLAHATQRALDAKRRVSEVA